MNSALATVLWLSVSGTLLALLLIACKPLLKRAAPCAFSYYVWLLVLLRLVLPIGAPLNVLEAVFPDAPPAGAQGAPPAGVAAVPAYIGTLFPGPQENEPPARADGEPGEAPARDAGLWALISSNLAAIWLTGAAGCLLHAWISYRRLYTKVLRTSVAPSDADRAVFLSMRPDERLRLVCNAYVHAPMLIGVLRPCIVVPRADYSQSGMRLELEHILRHEITHYRRRDLVYKWFMVAATSLHWFNPLMLLVRSRINAACELSCDAAVIEHMTEGERKQYGQTLILLSGDGKSRAGAVATTMSRHRRALKERIMNIKAHRAQTWAMRAAAAVLAVALTGCASLLGTPPGSSAAPTPTQQNGGLPTPTPTSSTGPLPAATPPIASLPKASPLPSPERSAALVRLPLNPQGLAPLEMPEDAPDVLPALYAWQYAAQPVDLDALIAVAEAAAERMWESVEKQVVEEEWNGRKTVYLSSEIAKTDYGPFQRQMTVAAYGLNGPVEAHLTYSGLWHLYEETPYHYGEQVERGVGELVAIAQATIADMGLTQCLTGPQLLMAMTEKEARGFVDEGVRAAQTVEIISRHELDGLPTGDGLTVKLINGKVARVSLVLRNLSRLETPPPAFILNAEEALYCVNYARSQLVGPEQVGRSVFASMAKVGSVSPVLTDIFYPDDDIFVPAWKFILVSDNGEPAYTAEIYVDAATGEVHTGTNEGRYASPYAR